jgi:hypothetical protein
MLRRHIWAAWILESWHMLFILVPEIHWLSSAVSWIRTM